MTAIDQLRATHRRAHTATVLEEALRAICDVLLSDDLEGAELYDAIERVVDQGCDAIDAYEEADITRVTVHVLEPPDPTEAVPVTCVSVPATSDEGQDLEGLGEDLHDDAPPPGDRRCGLTEEPVTVCTCARHRSEAEPETAPCATCGEPWPTDDYGKVGRHRSKSCPPCVSERQRRGAAKRHARAKARESADDKESV